MLSAVVFGAACQASSGDDLPDAVSVPLSDDFARAAELDDQLVRAAGEPSTPGGNLRGIDVVFGRAMPDGMELLDIEFSSDVTQADIDRLVRRAESLGLDGLIFLSDGDEWPFCADEEDCPVVGERL